MSKSAFTIPRQLPPSLLHHGRLAISFLGRQAPRSRNAALDTLGAGVPTAVAYLRQVHSARIVAARCGDCGEGDALWTTDRGLVLALHTADCVPVVIGSQDRFAVVHVGWRGVTAGIVPRAVRALGHCSTLSAWSGPAIRGCCYEVGERIAAGLAAASDGSVLAMAPGRRPKVDLVQAVRVQLRSAGVEVLRDYSPCTFCNAGILWSFRHDPEQAGRNHSFAWLSDDGVAFA